MSYFNLLVEKIVAINKRFCACHARHVTVSLCQQVAQGRVSIGSFIIVRYPKTVVKNSIKFLKTLGLVLCATSGCIKQGHSCDFLLVQRG